MAMVCEYVKALIVHLTDEQVEALQVIVKSVPWPTERVTPEEAAEIEEALAEIDAGKGVKDDPQEDCIP